ncbi:hypothetical protein [Pedobacter chinensis]|uniref:hypothetical protein n=1 Tax=Pedobacter chinensis TaxID=2282421 RepID=UPI001314CC90|nr:hypothetical protein [Pedobacter chinensis]
MKYIHVYTLFLMYQGIQVFIITMGNPFSILQQRMGLPVIQLFIFMKIKPVIFGKTITDFKSKEGR